jgi:hypothetical protein
VRGACGIGEDTRVCEPCSRVALSEICHLSLLATR